VAKTRFFFVAALGACMVGVFASPSHAVDSDELRDLLNMPLDDLSKVVVTSVSRKEGNVKDAAAAIYVLSQEEIRRSGVTSVPEALRMVPGVQVSRAGSNRWAITARGFNDQFANKLLVLIDGRTVYDPMFAGVFWDAQDVLLEDIDRIEVIRGPGATLWGSNGVNGVINILTKPSDETQGRLVSVGGGNQERGFVHARHGGTIGDQGHYRVYGKWQEHGNSRATNPTIPLDDDYRKWQAGFRADWEGKAATQYTMQGDAYKGSMDNIMLLPALSAPFYSQNPDTEHYHGFNLLGRMERDLGERSWKLQGYLDFVERELLPFQQKRWTADLDFQYRIQSWEAHDVVWGLNARLHRDDLQGSYYLKDRKSVV